MDRVISIVLGLLLLLALFAMTLLIYSAFTPFEPYELHGYAVQPKESCMGDIVELRVTRTLEEGEYNVNVFSRWEHKNGQTLHNPVAQYTLEGTGEKELGSVSPALQEAPEGPGVWEFVADVQVEGRVGLLPRKQTVREEGEGVITVLPNSDEKCDGRQNG